MQGAGGGKSLGRDGKGCRQEVAAGSGASGRLLFNSFSVMGRPHCWLRVQEPRGEAGPQDQDSSFWMEREEVGLGPEQERSMQHQSSRGSCPFK